MASKKKRKTQPNNPHRLTAKQAAFVDFYIMTWNATEAARLAGYSAKTARQMGSENLTKPVIQAAIKKAVDERAMGREEVLMRLTAQARGSVSDLMHLIYDDKGQPIPVWDFAKFTDPHYASMIESVKYNRHGIQVTLYSAQAALFQLAKAHGLDKSIVDLQSDGQPIQISRIVMKATETAP